MKKYLLITTIAMMILLVNVLFAKDYKDAEPVIKEMRLSLEKFIGGLEKADKASEVAKAVNEYSKAIISFAPKFKKMIEKYPELEDEKTHPGALKVELAKVDEMTKKLMRTFGKISKYMSDPEVKAAFENMNKASAAMDPIEEKEGEEK